MWNCGNTVEDQVLGLSPPLPSFKAIGPVWGQEQHHSITFWSEKILRIFYLFWRHGNFWFVYRSRKGNIVQEIAHRNFAQRQEITTSDFDLRDHPSWTKLYELSEKAQVEWEKNQNQNQLKQKINQQDADYIKYKKYKNQYRKYKYIVKEKEQNHKKSNNCHNKKDEQEKK